MHAASGGHTRFQKIKKSKLFENLNDALYNVDAYVCNLEIKYADGTNYCVLEKSGIGILKAKNVFRRLVAISSVRISRGSENFSLHC